MKKLCRLRASASVGAAAAPRSRAELRAWVARGDCEGFHVSGFARGHAPTDFARWLALETAAEVSSSYACAYAEGFEPYVLARVASVPRYDERFRGYGLNKVQHAFALARRGFAFEVLQDEVWVFADEHAKSKAWNRNYAKDSPEYDPEQALRVQALYNVFKREEEARAAVSATRALDTTAYAHRLEEGDPLGDADPVCVFFEKLPTSLSKTHSSAGLSAAANLLLVALLAAAALAAFCASNDDDDDTARTLLRGSLRGLVAASR